MDIRNHYQVAAKRAEQLDHKASQADNRGDSERAEALREAAAVERRIARAVSRAMAVARRDGWEL